MLTCGLIKERMLNEWLNRSITEMCGVWICEWMNV